MIKTAADLSLRRNAEVILIIPTQSGAGDGLPYRRIYSARRPKLLEPRFYGTPADSNRRYGRMNSEPREAGVSR